MPTIHSKALSVPTTMRLSDQKKPIYRFSREKFLDEISIHGRDDDLIGEARAKVLDYLETLDNLIFKGDMTQVENSANDFRDYVQNANLEAWLKKHLFDTVKGMQANAYRREIERLNLPLGECLRIDMRENRMKIFLLQDKLGKLIGGDKR